MRIARAGDLFDVHLDEEVKIVVAPLMGTKKLEMTSLVKQDGPKLVIDKAAQELFVIKHSVKKIDGLTDHRDVPYELEFEGDCLSDSCAEEVLGFLIQTFFTVAVTQIMAGKLGEVLNPYTGKPLQGVSVKLSEGNNIEGK